jgi:hypothetical protein
MHNVTVAHSTIIPTHTTIMTSTESSVSPAMPVPSLLELAPSPPQFASALAVGVLVVVAA